MPPPSPPPLHACPSPDVSPTGLHAAGRSVAVTRRSGAIKHLPGARCLQIIAAAPAETVHGEERKGGKKKVEGGKRITGKKKANSQIETFQLSPRPCPAILLVLRCWRSPSASSWKTVSPGTLGVPDAAGGWERGALRGSFCRVVPGCPSVLWNHRSARRNVRRCSESNLQLIPSPSAAGMGQPPLQSHLGAAAHLRAKRCSCNSWLDKECIYFCHLDIIWVNTPG